ncbi:CoA transferase, partial [Pseudomonas sp. RA_35y_Pfl2_P32]|uniref:CoA transferase n=1 Tax=Pseudomonas sp. RA_35y_Pfl2_P32 TaxID=3088705 RepID=UPI0030D72F1B
LADRFKLRTRDAWVSAFEGHEACIAPVLGFDEAIAHPHNVARATFVTAGGVTQPAPAPRYSVSATVPRAWRTHPTGPRSWPRQALPQPRSQRCAFEFRRRRIGVPAALRKRRTRRSPHSTPPE